MFSCKCAAYFQEHLFLRTPLDGCFWIYYCSLMLLSFRYCMSYITIYLSQKVRIYCSTIWKSFVKNALRLIFTVIIQLWAFIFSKTTCTNRTIVRPGSMQYVFPRRFQILIYSIPYLFKQNATGKRVGGVKFRNVKLL